MSIFRQSNHLGNGSAAQPGGDTVARFAARLKGVPSPLVTVIIPVFNKWDVTARCLESLVACDVDIPIQILVVDDESTDETAASLAVLRGIDVVRNGTNAGFLHSCNRGVSLARGQFLFFLNNDTEVRENALRALVRRVQQPGVGIAGSKLIYPDGRLQDAGGIIFSDASGWNYGRLDHAERPEYNFSRDVDYVSGASLMIESALFQEVGGFDVRYAPAYYEDTDLCFSVRSRGLRVMYEPRSVVVHYEGISSGTDTSTGVKRFQVVNHPKFREKWAEALERDHLPPDLARVRTAARIRGGARRTILIIDTYVPLYDRESGSNRLRRLIDGFIAAGQRVVFLPDNLAAEQPYTLELQDLGIEVMYHTDGDPRSWLGMLHDALQGADVAWICRPELCRKYLPAIRDVSDIPIVYDTIDLHHVRVRRQAELKGTDDDAWRDVEDLELTCARAADATIVVSETEAEVLRMARIDPVAVVSNIHAETPGVRAFGQTSGLLFIGGYNHNPNVDAVLWLVNEIMPRVWAAIPGVRLTLLGASPPAGVLALAGDHVAVPGYVADVDPYFRAARIFVAPLRYGAGIKGKIGHALSYHVPTVTTPIGAEGFDLKDGANAFIAEDAASFAAAVVRLYRDPDLWQHFADGATDALRPFGPDTVIRRALDVIDQVCAQRSRRATNPL